MASLTLGAWMMMASTAVTAYSAYHQGQVENANAKYASQVADRNAAIAAQQGAAAQAQQKRDMRLRLGAASAAYGASGVDPTSGTPLDVFSNSVGQGTLDNLTIGYDYKLRGMGYQGTSAMDKVAGSQASTSGVLGALGTGLSGASKTYGIYRNNHPGTGIQVTPGSGASSGSWVGSSGFN